MHRHHFKFITDSLGHKIGDKALRDIASIIKEYLREHDLLGRIGEDVFIVLLPNTERETSLEFAQSYFESFQEPFLIDSYELFITASIGMSIFPYVGNDLDELIPNADAALYRAKEYGSHLYQIYHSGLNIPSYKSFIMQRDLREALENNEMEV